MNIGPLEDCIAIRDLCETFTVAAICKDIEKWGNTWAEDARWKMQILPEAIVGRENIKATMEARFPFAQLLSMIVCGTEIVVDGNRATGKIYHQEIVFLASGDPRKFLIGCYSDEYIKLDGRWYFTSRDYEVLGRA